MSYFSGLLSQQAHPLRLPKKSKDDIERFVLQHQKGPATVDWAPFRRQVDFWALSIAVAAAENLPAVEKPSSQWGVRFADTRAVQMNEPICDLLAVLALDKFGANAEELDDPAAIVELGNKLAAAGCPVVLKHLMNPDLRVSNLDKTFDLVASLLKTEDDAGPGGA